jgi:hypothetical protein
MRRSHGSDGTAIQAAHDLGNRIRRRRGAGVHLPDTQDAHGGLTAAPQVSRYRLGKRMLSEFCGARTRIPSPLKNNLRYDQNAAGMDRIGDQAKIRFLRQIGPPR